MDRYNFRTTSLNNAQLTAELAKRGAKTFGSLERKQQRLQRFIDAETKTSQKKEILRVVIENEQRRVYNRMQTRAEEIRARARITTLMNEYLGW
jgi:hypothetical protein